MPLAMKEMLCAFGTYNSWLLWDSMAGYSTSKLPQDSTIHGQGVVNPSFGGALVTHLLRAGKIASGDSTTQ